MAAASLPLIGADDAGERLKRFNDAKFGMFIHWGPYSLASVEASWPIMRRRNWGITEEDYRALPERFNPVKFDARAWVRLAKAAGQRYMVFTTKHHDGFCMFDSPTPVTRSRRRPTGRTSWPSWRRRPRPKDAAGLLLFAARHESSGFRDTSKLSATNWDGEPDRPEWPLYLDYMELQLRELLTRYGDVFVIWFDGLGNQEKYDGTASTR